MEEQQERRRPDADRPEKKPARGRPRGIRLPIALAAAALIAAAAVILPAVLGGRGTPGGETVITISDLEEIVDISELSTFTAVYNGVAEVKDREDGEKTDYYVSYEAKVNAGIDFEQMSFAVDGEEKIIRVTLPAVHITRSSVDITTLDYIFLDESRNTSAVTQEAYRACEADVERESAEEDAILELARQNAENIIKAMLQPFIEQLEQAYVLDIAWEG